MVTTIYIRLHHRVQVKRYKPILLKDIAIISAPEKHKKILEPIEIHKVWKKDQNIVVLDGMKIIQRITENIGNCDIQLVGPQQTIIEIVTQKVKMSKPLFLLAWLLLFMDPPLRL